MSKYEKFESFEFDEYNEFETYNEGSSLRKKRRPRKKQKQKKQSGINPFLIGFILLSFVAAFLRQINSSLHGDSAQGEIEEYKEIIDSYARQQESKKAQSSNRKRSAYSERELLDIVDQHFFYKSVRNNIVPNDRVNSIRNLFQRGLISHQAIDHFQHLYDQLDFSNNDEVNNLSDFTSRLLYDEKFGEDVYNKTDAKDLYEDSVLFNGANVAKIKGPRLIHIDEALQDEFEDRSTLARLVSQAYHLQGSIPTTEDSYINTLRRSYEGLLAIAQSSIDRSIIIVVFPDGAYSRFYFDRFNR